MRARLALPHVGSISRVCCNGGLVTSDGNHGTFVKQHEFRHHNQASVPGRGVPPACQAGNQDVLRRGATAELACRTVLAVFLLRLKGSGQKWIRQHDVPKVIQPGSNMALGSGEGDC